ncbi:hypothetical protein Taro_048535 [Colocasia esculenta]|uniref:Uncharacterized protein n=1 Tax=Colocasia esculenta TaxID=4460 RepID=A0A843X8E0_COLES|nr:hypothetical protein [Colocasia esculenta]
MTHTLKEKIERARAYSQKIAPKQKSSKISDCYRRTRKQSLHFQNLFSTACSFFPKKSRVIPLSVGRETSVEAGGYAPCGTKGQLVLGVENLLGFALSIIEDGDLQISKPKEEWTDEDRKKKSLNSKAKSFMCCALSKQEFNRISTCKIAKDIWGKLKLTYERKNNVKETRIDILVTKYKEVEIEEMIVETIEIESIKETKISSPPTTIIQEVLKKIHADRGVEVDDETHFDDMADANVQRQEPFIEGEQQEAP